MMGIDMDGDGVIIGLAVFSQLLWGTYPALGRFLQTRIPGEPSAAVVLSAALFLALGAILIDLWRLLAQERREHAYARLGREEVQAVSLTASQHPLSASSTLPSSPKEPSTPASPPPGALLSPWPPSKEAVHGIVLYSLVTLGRMGTNMWASGMTYAYLNALVMLLQPYSVAVLEKFFFNSAFPQGLFPLLVTSSIGSILVIYAQTEAGMDANSDSDSDSDSGSSCLRSRDYWAIALQFVSVLFSTASRLVARGTKKHVTRHELLIGQFGVTAVILGIGVAVVDPVHGWGTILSMPASGWGALCFLSFAVYGVGQNLNVIVIRRISATLLTSLSSVRLVMACFSSYVILNEPIVNWIQWLGIAIVFCSISLYVRVQVGGTAAPSPGADVNTKSVEMTTNPVLVLTQPEPKV